ncbi:hypothetical protein EXE59_15865 [Nocardioides eburneiflavus]|uniref:DUF4175 domain-containing protein n=1 Tax=Nocardioides eburneiflavus TaxID=2518372 RepID=A0A4Z1CMN3_9ACTN|nr:hypothetical protein [Nocardioides eburneiflavus]TGN65269.1 hypothetical protein EXE59_15865 [Nocardioides eburneiflavus]
MPDRRPSAPLSPWPIAGLVGLACVAFMIGATTVAVGAPWWAMLGVAMAWLVALVLAIAWFSRRPRAVVLLPVAVALLWFGTVVGGARYLGWS